MEKIPALPEKKAKKELLGSYDLPETATDEELAEAISLRANVPTDKEFRELMDSQNASFMQRPENFEKTDKEEVEELKPEHEVVDFENPFTKDRMMGFEPTEDGYAAKLYVREIDDIWRAEKEDIEERLGNCEKSLKTQKEGKVKDFFVATRDFYNKILENWPKKRV